MVENAAPPKSAARVICTDCPLITQLITEQLQIVTWFGIQGIVRTRAVYQNVDVINCYISLV